MSSKGGQNGGKDGGVHTGPHETSLGIEIGVSAGILDKDNLIHVNETVERATSIQDGGAESGSNGGAQSMQLSLSSDSEDDGDDCDELDSYSYERAVVENNSEWLKSRCRNLDGVVFDSNDDMLVLEKNELFDGEHIAEDGVLPLCTEGTVLTSAQDSVLQSKASNVVIFPMDDGSNNLTGQSEGGVHISLPENITLKDDKGSDQSDVFPLEFNSLSDKAGLSLMTTQELESLRGLDFDESPHSVTNSLPTIINNKITSSPNKSNLINTELCSSKNSTTSVPNIGVESGSMLITQPSIVAAASDISGNASSQTSAISSSTYLVATPSAQSISGTQETPAGPGGLTLATISISTDKTSNSTQILVNTNQGQQLYLINTADLTQATNALQPLAQPLPQTQPVPQEPLPSQNQSPPPVRTGQVQWQGTGYLLLPVNQGEGGIFLSSAMTNLPSVQAEGTPKKLYMCTEPGCAKIFKKHSKLRLHLMRHSGERPFKCSRPGCDWAFTTAYKLKRHEESHEGRKDYICDIDGCDRKFTTVYNLNSHKKLHERPCNEVCPEPDCGVRFPTKRQLDLHMRTHTGKEKTYKCPVEGCDKVFFSPNCMGSHTRVHLQDREDLRCTFEGCGKVFDKQCRLKQHMRRHTGEKPYVCQYEGCTWAFTTASKLKRHMAKHTGLRKWVCQVCNKAFMRAEHLKGHLVTHSGIKPFCCPVEGCKARFTAKSSLYVHLKKHDQSGKKITYHCPMEGCSKHYSTKASLRNHILKHYLTAPPGADTSYLDLVPLLAGDDIPEGALDSLTQIDTSSGSTVSSTSSNNLPITSMVGVHDPAGSPADFVNVEMTDQALMSTMASADASPDQLNTNIVNQLLSSSSVKQEGVTCGDTPKITLVSASTDTIDTSPINTDNSGSARTDSHSNHVLSNKARKRWHQLRGGISSDSSSSSMDVVNFQDTTDKTSMETASISPSELLSIQGLVFRDPETGVTYVQTQLLQDDPPHPTLYGDDITGMVTDAVGLPDSPTASLGNLGVSSPGFTGTTINLQDLE